MPSTKKMEDNNDDDEMDNIAAKANNANVKNFNRLYIKKKKIPYHRVILEVKVNGMDIIVVFCVESLEANNLKDKD